MNTFRDSRAESISEQLVLFEMGSVPEVTQSSNESDSDIDRYARYEYPEPLARLRYERMARRAGSSAVSHAYAELGGGVTEVYEDNTRWFDSYTELTEAVRFTPYDIIQGFERMNIAKLLAQQPRDAQLREEAKVALHFGAYIQQLRSRSQVLATEGSYLDSHFGIYGFEDQEQAREYGTVLKTFHDDILHLPMGRYLYTYAHEHSLTAVKARADIKRHGGKLPYIVWDKKRRDFHVHYEIEKATKNHAA